MENLTVSQLFYYLLLYTCREIKKIQPEYVKSSLGHYTLCVHSRMIVRLFIAPILSFIVLVNLRVQSVDLISFHFTMGFTMESVIHLHLTLEKNTWSQ